MLEFIEMEVRLFSISCLFKNCAYGFRWMFSSVYGPVVESRREVVWEELGSIRGLWDGPWCVKGDFNMTCVPGERKRGGRTSTSMRRFFDVVEDLRLKETPLERGPFT